MLLLLPATAGTGSEHRSDPPTCGSHFTGSTVPTVAVRRGCGCSSASSRCSGMCTGPAYASPTRARGSDAFACGSSKSTHPQNTPSALTAAFYVLCFPDSCPRPGLAWSAARSEHRDLSGHVSTAPHSTGSAETSTVSTDVTSGDKYAVGARRSSSGWAKPSVRRHAGLASHLQ